MFLGSLDGFMLVHVFVCLLVSTRGETQLTPPEFLHCSPEYGTAFELQVQPCAEAWLKIRTDPRLIPHSAGTITAGGGFRLPFTYYSSSSGMKTFKCLATNLKNNIRN